MIQFLGVGQGADGYFLILKNTIGAEYQIPTDKQTYSTIQKHLSVMGQGDKIPELGRK